MGRVLDFYYDFSSPYGYLASMHIQELANDIGARVIWRPVLLGPMFQAMGSAPLVQIPIKGDYAVRDIVRSAELFDVPFNMPEPFPISTVGAARAALVLRKHSMACAADFSKAVFQAYFAQGRDIRDQAVILDIARQCGADADQVGAGMTSQAIKDQLKADVEAAMKRGVFGAPFMFVDDEPFWGFDRFEHIRSWVKRQET